MVLHFKSWLAVMKNVDGTEEHLVLFNVTDNEEAKEEIRKRLRHSVEQEIFDAETTDTEDVNIAERASENNKRKRVFFLATINGEEKVVAEIRQRNKSS